MGNVLSVKRVLTNLMPTQNLDKTGYPGCRGFFSFLLIYT